MRARTILTALTIAFALATGFGPDAAAQKKGGRNQTASVAADPVRLEVARQTVPVIGRLVASQSGVVSALSKGVVAKLRVRIGDRVEQAQVLAVLGKDTLKWTRELSAADVKSADARLAAARAGAELRRQELARLDNLRQSSAFSPARFEDTLQELARAEAAIGEAEAQHDRAKANLELAKIALSNADVKAPYSGVVTALHTEVGTYLSIGQQVATLIGDSDLEIEADVPADRLSGLHAGQVVRVLIRGDKELDAFVRAQIPDENPMTRTRAVRFTPDLKKPNHGYAVNQSVTLFIPTGPEQEMLTVAKDAVIAKDGGNTVFIIVDGKAEPRRVVTGQAVGDRFEVRSGLKDGDIAIIRGNERLRPGQAVKATPIGERQP